jgi:hypothetical protein
MALLEDLALVEQVDGGYLTPEDFEGRMERELEESGCNEVERLQREKVAREQEAFRNRKARTPDEVPQPQDAILNHATDAEMPAGVGKDEALGDNAGVLRGARV